MGEPKIVVKKVSAYPIVCQLNDSKGGAPQPANIVKLTTGGVLVETVRNLPLGSNWQLNFVLPVVESPIQTNGIVVKGYTRFGGTVAGQRSNALNEVQLKSLTDGQRVAIAEFLNRINKKASA